MTVVSLCTGGAGRRVGHSPEGGDAPRTESSGQQLPRKCRPSSDLSRCAYQHLGPPATVTPGRLLASPSGANPDWLLSPRAHDTAPEGCCCCGCCGCCGRDVGACVCPHTDDPEGRARPATNSCTTGGLTPGSSTPGVSATPEPSMTKNSSSSRAPQLRKLALNSGITRRSAKIADKPLKNPSPPLYAESVPVSVANENVHQLWR